MTNHKVYIVVAVDSENGIGKDGTIPWHLAKEMKYFKELTSTTADPEKKNMVIMGRTTWESIPDKYRPLPNRKNVVLTRNPDYKAEGAIIAHSYEDALALADEDIEEIHVIGGGQIFEESLKHHYTTGLYITKLDRPYDCDTYFPEIPQHFSQRQKLDEDEEDGVRFTYYLYTLQT